MFMRNKSFFFFALLLLFLVAPYPSWAMKAAGDTVIVIEPYPSNPTGSQYLTDNDVYTIYSNAFDGMSILETTNSYQTHYLRMNYGWADYADYGIYSITGSDREEGLNYNVMMFYNFSPGQLGNS